MTWHVAGFLGHDCASSHLAAAGSEHRPGCTLGETDRMERSAGKERIVKHDRIMKTRQRLARHVERAALPERPFIGPGPRHRPAERYRCVRSSLREIAGVLRDEAHLIDEESLEAVKRFLTDGASSPYFGRDSTRLSWRLSAFSTSSARRRPFSTRSGSPSPSDRPSGRGGENEFARSLTDTTTCHLASVADDATTALVRS